MALDDDAKTFFATLQDGEIPTHITKEQARYRLASDDDGEACSMCDNIVPPKACHLVEGEISPDYTCDFFEIEEGDNEDLEEATRGSKKMAR